MLLRGNTEKEERQAGSPGLALRANTSLRPDWRLSVLITMAMYGSVDSHPGVGLRPTPRATRQVAFFLAGLALVAVVAIGYHLYDMQ